MLDPNREQQLEGPLPVSAATTLGTQSVTHKSAQNGEEPPSYCSGTQGSEGEGQPMQNRGAV